MGKWQIEVEPGRWVDYGPNEQQLIRLAQLTGQPSANWEADGLTYQILFDRRVQRIIQTGTTRAIRPVAVSAQTVATPAGCLDPAELIWQVQMPNGKWEHFGPEEQRIIQAASRNGQPSARFSARGFEYEISFEESVQRNLQTGKERPVRSG